jgi:hypothetical protein
LALVWHDDHLFIHSTHLGFDYRNATIPSLWTMPQLLVLWKLLVAVGIRRVLRLFAESNRADAENLEKQLW